MKKKLTAMVLALGAMLGAWASTVNLSALTADYVAKDGDTLTGKIGGASVSGSSQLVKTEDGWQVTLYAPPKPTAKPPFAGWCETFPVTLSFGDANVVSDVSLE